MLMLIQKENCCEGVYFITIGVLVSPPSIPLCSTLSLVVLLLLSPFKVCRINFEMVQMLRPDRMFPKKNYLLFVLSIYAPE